MTKQEFTRLKERYEKAVEYFNNNTIDATEKEKYKLKFEQIEKAYQKAEEEFFNEKNLIQFIQDVCKNSEITADIIKFSELNNQKLLREYYTTHEWIDNSYADMCKEGIVQACKRLEEASKLLRDSYYINKQTKMF